MNSFLTLENKNIRTERGTIINPLPVLGYEKINDYIVLSLEDNNCPNGHREGIIDSQGKILIPFNYYFILTDDNFKENGLLVAENFSEQRIYIDTKDWSISLRD